MAPRLLRRAGALPGVERLVAAALRARRVREPLRFLAADLGPRRRGRLRVYHERTSGVPVVLEHHTPDLTTFDEIWGLRVYEPPAGVPFDALPAPPRVIDLGANVGMFAAWVAARCPGANGLAYEPDPRNRAALAQTLALCAGRLRAWEVRAAVAGAAARAVAFAADGRPDSRVVAEGGIEVPCVDVLPELERCDLLKIDIEGGEWEILEDARFARCGAGVVVVEPHPGRHPDPVAAARGLLERAGYASVTAPGLGDDTVWGYRPA